MHLIRLDGGGPAGQDLYFHPKLTVLLGAPSDVVAAVVDAVRALADPTVAAPAGLVEVDRTLGPIRQQVPEGGPEPFLELRADRRPPPLPGGSRIGPSVGGPDRPDGGASGPVTGDPGATARRTAAERIGELLASGSVSVDTRVVLTSAVFMKALWDVPFEKTATAEGAFTLADGTEVAVPLMRRRARLIAGTSGSGGAAATICEIPYDGERLVMVLVVPTAREGLPAVLAGLDGDWRESATAAKRRQVVLALPRWTSRQRLSLKAALESLGMRRAFVTGRADFSGVNGGQDLVVSDVVHEGFVEVTEEGTEAAAATGVVLDMRSAVTPEKPLEVIADRPFAWAIVEQRTGAVLFAGTVTDPR